MIRVLHIVTRMDRAGLETFLMNVYRKINREKVQFDFLVHCPDEADYDEEIRSLGGRIFHVPPFNPLNPNYWVEVFSTLRQLHPEDSIVHSHIDALSAIPLFLAACAGFQTRIAHSHTASFDKDWKYYVRRFLSIPIPWIATDLFACGDAAGKNIFGDNSNYHIVTNGVDVESFRFDFQVRNQVRRSIGAENKKVVIHVGRFVPLKNHSFIIKELVEKAHYTEEVLFLLVGDGPDRAMLEKYCRERGLVNRVRFLGVRDNIPRLLQGADVFVLPSLFEGLSVAIVEAQSAGLPCLISNTIPKDCFITDLVQALPLGCPDDWIRAIDTAQSSNRAIYAEKMSEAGFDIGKTAKWLQDFYLEHSKDSQRGVS